MFTDMHEREKECRSPVKGIKIKQRIRVKSGDQCGALPSAKKSEDHGFEVERTPQASITWECSRELVPECVSCEAPWSTQSWDLPYIQNLLVGDLIVPAL